MAAVIKDEDLMALGRLFGRFFADEEVFIWLDGRRLVIDGNIWNLSEDEKDLVKRFQKEDK